MLHFVRNFRTIFLYAPGWPGARSKRKALKMKTIDLKNFGKLKVLGQGTLEPLTNDGSYKFHACDLRTARGENYVSDRDALNDGWMTGFIILDTTCVHGESYGYILGDSIENCLEEYFRILSENGLGIAEIEE